MPRRRVLALAAVALAVPLPAFALTGGPPTPAGPSALSVAAALGECGIADTAIVCRIDASWNSLPQADHYSVTVTRADGSVADYGQTGGSGTSVWVPYAGPGTYSVEVAAWETTDDDADAAEPELIARDTSSSTAGHRGKKDPAPVTTDPADDGETPAELGEEEPTDEPPATPVDEQPACDETPSEEPPSEESTDEEQAAERDAEPALEDVSDETAAALEAEAELPDSLACP